MGKFYILTQILHGNALFTGKIYTARKFFTRPPVATVVTNFKSVCVPVNVECERETELLGEIVCAVNAQLDFKHQK